MPGTPNSFLFLVVGPGTPNSILVTRFRQFVRQTLVLKELVLVLKAWEQST